MGAVQASPAGLGCDECIHPVEQAPNGSSCHAARSSAGTWGTTFGPRGRSCASGKAARRGAVAQDMTTRCRVLLVSGSLRARSTNTAVVRTAHALTPAGVEAVVYGGLGALPQFNPDDDHDPLPAAVAELREQIRSADALLFSIPEYAGALPGSLKNLLDWSIGDDHPRSMYEKPVSWINASPRGAVNAHEQLRQVLGYAHARIIEPACVQVAITGALVGDDMLIADLPTRTRILEALTTLTTPLEGAADHIESQ